MNTNILIFLRIILLLIISTFISNRICNVLITYFNKRRVGQEISSYLSSNHQNKKNTPTIGGIGIILSIMISSLFIFDSYFDYQFILGIIILFLFFIIGLIDDLLKLFLKSHDGLSPLFRILLEILIVLIIYLFLDNRGVFDYSFHINEKYKVFLGPLFIIFSVLLIVGSSNSVNLTDGLDGLASGLFMIAILPFIIFLLLDNNINLVYLLVMVYGATFGFVILNLHPAKIFMGDSGSLPLGAILGYIALLSKKELLLVIIGGLFVFETISVILQVLFFKITKKRIFLMSPFHHHLELMGKKEYTIVMGFYLIGFTLSLIGLIIGIKL